MPNSECDLLRECRDKLTNGGRWHQGDDYVGDCPDCSLVKRIDAALAEQPKQAGEPCAWRYRADDKSPWALTQTEPWAETPQVQPLYAHPAPDLSGLAEMAHTLQHWLDWQQSASPTLLDDDVHFRTPPVYPTRGTLKNWIAALRGQSS